MLAIHKNRIPILRYASILVAAVLVSGKAFAETPRKAPLTRYTGLWTNSPFTSKPPPAQAAPANNPLDDYTLSGVAPIPGGYRITLINRKNQTERLVIEPGSSAPYSFVSLRRDPNKLLGTIVTLTDGRIQGTVSFEPELLTPIAPPPPQQNPKVDAKPAPDTEKKKPAKTTEKTEQPPRRRIVVPSKK
ncbi:MAG: hypothetical protein ACSHX7_09200 [Luteolibacter sp.]